MSKKDESMSGAEIAEVARVLVGPEEDWDEADGEFAMKLFGVEPSLSTKEMCDLILGVIGKFKKEGEEVPSSLINVLTQLASKLKREDPRVMTTLSELKERLSQKGSKGLAAVAVKRFRGKTKLSKKDEKILQDLEDELLTEKQDED